jgi:hypothetical protein
MDQKELLLLEIIDYITVFYVTHNRPIQSQYLNRFYKRIQKHYLHNIFLMQALDQAGLKRIVTEQGTIYIYPPSINKTKKGTRNII